MEKENSSSGLIGQASDAHYPNYSQGKLNLAVKNSSRIVVSAEENEPTKPYKYNDVNFLYVRESSYHHQRNRAILKKYKIIADRDYSCERCGYNKNLAALEFHHIDPNVKSFAMDGRTFANLSPDKIEKEATKCMLLCSNCHKEIHFPHYFMEDIKKMVDEFMGDNTLKTKQMKLKNR